MNFVELAKLKEELSCLDLDSRDPFNVYRRALDCIDELLFSIEEIERDCDCDLTPTGS